MNFDFFKNLGGSPVDAYGFSSLIAQSLGLKSTPRTIGIFYPHAWEFREVIIAAQLFSDNYRSNRINFIASKNEIEFCKKAKIPSTKISALPIVYTSKQYDSERIPGSTLVMLPHCIDESRLIYDEDQILKEFKDFDKSKTLFCIHGADIKKGNWINSLSKLGFKYTKGSDFTDIDSLNRMRKMFTQYETMHTNVFGSHVLYAAYFGCKISVTPKLYEYKWEEVLNDTAEKIPSLASRHYFHCLQGQTKKIIKAYSFLFCEDVRQAKTHKEWAIEEIGEKNKLSPEELAYWFGWTSYLNKLSGIRVLWRIPAKFLPSCS